MRPLIMAFLILAPFIAVAQNYHLHALPLPALVHAPAHFAHHVAADAGMKMSGLVHAVQDLLS